MKAAVIEKQGGIENITYRDWEDPTPGDADVVVVKNGKFKVRRRRGVMHPKVSTPA